MAARNEFGRYIKIHIGPTWWGAQVSMRLPDGSYLSKLFSYSHYGDFAPWVARDWRDEMHLLAFKKPFSPNENFVHFRASVDSSTGVLGVYRYIRTAKTRHKRKIYISSREVIAAVHPTGKPRREWSIDKWGLNEAIRLATQARLIMVKDHLG